MRRKWYCIRKVGEATVRTDEVIEQQQCGYVAQWKAARAVTSIDQTIRFNQRLHKLAQEMVLARG